MRKKLLILSLTTLTAFSVNAESSDGPEVEINGGIDFQAGYLKNSAPVKEKYFITGNNKNMGFNSTAYVAVDAHNTTDSGLIYGAKVALATTTRSSRKSSSSLYVVSQAGKWELGSEKSANAKMKITPYTNACATGGGWDVWVKSDPNDTKTVYVTNFGNFLDPKTRHIDQSEYSRKVTYYTPEFYGLQLGLSYVPDTTNVGYEAFGKPERHDPTKNSFYDVDIKNAFAGGITYANTISDDMKFKIALVGETGKAIGKKKTSPAVSPAAQTSLPDNITFKKLRAYTIGAQIDYKDCSFTGAYSDYMKSLTANELDYWHDKNTRLYGFGARYNHPSKVSVSATYFVSKNKGNQMKATTLAMEYKAAPGIMPYAELTFYKTNGKYQTKTDIQTDKNHGTNAILGIKLEF